MPAISVENESLEGKSFEIQTLQGP